MIEDWDDAYANRAYFVGTDECLARWARDAPAFRSAMAQLGRFEGDIPYGGRTREKFDLFMSDAAPRGLAVFVHGGYWRSFAKEDWSHLARGAVEQGWAMAIIGYDICPDVRIGHISLQVHAGISAAAARVSGPIRLAGHSAGGHLAARAICDDFAGLGRVEKVLSLSGVHDLRPMLRTKMNEDFKMDLAEAIRESPALLTPQAGVAVTAWVGAEERPEFIRQAKLLANVWTGCGIATKYVEQIGKNHFTLIDDLQDPQSAMMAEFLE